VKNYGKSTENIKINRKEINMMAITTIKLILRCSIIGIVLVNSGCSSTELKTTEVTPVYQVTENIPENELLDVGITIFDPGLEQLADQDDDMLVFPEIRIAEASYFPYILMETVQSSSAWGAVRVIPVGHQSVDVTVKGSIKHSDGEMLDIDITVSDSSGRHWFTKSYHEKASHYAYNKKTQLRYEPFQNIYNLITNDLNNYRQKLSSKELQHIRLVSELKFAQSFSQQKFSQYLASDDNGRVVINRLPAENEPLMVRIKRIRERDYLFIDTLQEYYGSYVKEMKAPYKEWRHESFKEVVAMRKMQYQARNQKIIGAAAIIAGILGAGNSSASVRAASIVGMTAGGYVLKDGMERSEEALIHVEALQELGDSLEASIESQVIELEDRTVTLSGTVDNQYQQWRKILQEIYRVDTDNSIH